MVHWFLTGFERGIYNDSSIRLNEECFGDYYVTKLNEYEYLFTEDPFENIFDNIFPEISLTYQFIYMFNNQCDIDETIFDFMVFCWYQGCYPQQMLMDSGSKILYIMRAINDAAIVWYEDIPEDEIMNEDNLAEWNKVAEHTGATVASIVQDITDFHPVPRDQRK